MDTITTESRTILQNFASIFRSKKVFAHGLVLLSGFVLSWGRRTVCGSLRMLGKSGETRFHKYHRVLSHARWCLRRGSRLLLSHLLARFGGEGSLVFGLDETLERRWGRRISARGIYRDAVRSSRSHFVKCSGLRWMCLMFLAEIPWAQRVWALPFLTVLAPSERYAKEHKKRHKKLTDWARQMVLQLRRWLPHRHLVVVADSSYAALELLDSVRRQVCFITRLRLDAALYDAAPARTKGKAGRTALKGKRQITLVQRLEDLSTTWQTVLIPKWYGQSAKTMLLTSGTAVWYHTGMPPVPIRWVLLKDPEGKSDPAALLCTDLEQDPIQIVSFFIRRWTVEVTFEEVRAHLGVETQRQWSDNAIARTTPTLMGLFSLVALWADEIQKHQNILQTQAAWYHKKIPTFSDAIAAVRLDFMANPIFDTSRANNDIPKIHDNFLFYWLAALARAA